MSALVSIAKTPIEYDVMLSATYVNDEANLQKVKYRLAHKAYDLEFAGLGISSLIFSMDPSAIEDYVSLTLSDLNVSWHMDPVDSSRVIVFGVSIPIGQRIEKNSVQ